MATPGISLDGLHWYLWDHRTPSGQVTITQKVLADQLCVSRQRAVQVIGELVKQGRLHKTPTRSRYTVTDPAS